VLFFLSCLITGFRLQAEVNLPQDPFVLMTVPKSGSHMIIKALHFLTGTSPIWHTHFPSRYYVPPKDGFLYTHFCLSEWLEDNYLYLPKLKKIVNVRDLRDVAVSMVNHIRKGLWPGMNAEQRKEFKSWPFDQQLLFVIQYEYDVREVACFAPNSLQISMRKIAEQVERYSKDPTCLVCHYEDLVGVQGGGSEEKQLAELRKISKYLNLDVEDDTLQEVARNLYGNDVNPFGQGDLTHFRSTFNSGKVGKWKEVFNEGHKKAFKERLGEALIALGYEEDYNW
jgi:hypothetical protein